MKFSKLNARGFSHDILIVAFVAIFAIGGVAYLVASHADSCPPVSGVTSGPTSQPSSGCPVSGSFVRAPLYRMWSPTATDHFYTDSATTEQTAVKYYGYSYEGIEGYVYSTNPNKNTLPLYRMWSPTATDHFYTDSATTEQTAVKYYGYSYEGIEGYVSSIQTTNTTPLYRLWNGQIKDHFYTTSVAQKDQAIKFGYSYEGIEGYLYTTQMQ